MTGTNREQPVPANLILPKGKVAETIKLAQEASKCRAWQEAALLWSQVIEISPRQAVAYVAAGNALRESGQYDAAERILDTAAALFPDHEQIAIARGWTANARGDWATAISRWENVCIRFPDAPQGYTGMAAALRRANRHPDIEMFRRAAKVRLDAAGPPPPASSHLIGLELEIARLASDWPNMRSCAERIITYETQRTPLIYLTLCQSCWQLGDLNAAEAAAKHALTLNPALIEAFIVLSRISTERGDSEATLSYYQSLAELNPQSSVWPRKRVQLLNWVGQIDQAFNEAKISSSAGPMTRWFGCFCVILGQPLYCCRQKICLTN